MMLRHKRGVIPKDKPKSWVLMLLSCVNGLLIAVPVMAAGYFSKHETLLSVGVFLYFLCWLVFAVMWIIYITGTAKGRYYNVEERDWCDQVW